MQEEGRIEGGIEAVGFNRLADPERIRDLQDMQKMYERIADELREKRHMPFSMVLSQIRGREEEKGDS